MSELHGKLRILSIEDQPETVAGSLAGLRLEGHTVMRAKDVESAQARLEQEAFDLVIIDQQLPSGGRLEPDAGAQLARELKQGRLGSLNVGAAFIFVTGSREWVDESQLTVLDGYMGVALKGGDLSRRLQEAVSRLTEPG